MEDRASALPVFVFPNTLDVVASQPRTHKQIVTLYNPYEFPVNYKVLCTAPKLYSVIEPRGMLKGKCCIDIVIRHLAASSRSNIGACDRFRFEVCKCDEEEVTGRKDIVVRVLENAIGIEQPSLDQSEFRSVSPSQASLRQRASLQHSLDQNTDLHPLGSSQWIAVMAALICIIALMLPSQGDTESTLLPSYLHLSVPQKLVAAYVLGIVTMLIVRPT